MIFRIFAVNHLGESHPSEEFVISPEIFPELFDISITPPVTSNEIILQRTIRSQFEPLTHIDSLLDRQLDASPAAQNSPYVLD